MPIEQDHLLEKCPDGYIQVNGVNVVAKIEELIADPQSLSPRFLALFPQQVNFNNPSLISLEMPPNITYTNPWPEIAHSPFKNFLDKLPDSAYILAGDFWTYSGKSAYYNLLKSVFGLEAAVTVTGGSLLTRKDFENQLYTRREFLRIAGLFAGSCLATFTTLNSIIGALAISESKNVIQCQNPSVSISLPEVHDGEDRTYIVTKKIRDLIKPEVLSLRGIPPEAASQIWHIAGLAHFSNIKGIQKRTDSLPNIAERIITKEANFMVQNEFTNDEIIFQLSKIYFRIATLMIFKYAPVPEQDRYFECVHDQAGKVYLHHPDLIPQNLTKHEISGHIEQYVTQVLNDITN